MSTEPNTSGCPLPTPELVAALANAYIEECALDEGSSANMARAFASTVGPFEPWAGRGAVLCHAAGDLARTLKHPRPYECQVTLRDGSTQPATRHTITHFVDGEGFSAADWSAISTLEPGEAYIISGQAAIMCVTRME